jgi:hypothetical protein
VSRRGKHLGLSPALNSLVRRLDRGSGGAYAAARVADAWERVRGDMVASHSTGAHLRDGILVVLVDGNSWATHFAASSEQYRDALNKELGEELVSGIRFTVSKRAARESDSRNAHPAGEDEDPGENGVVPVPLSETELAQVTASVNRIPDAELRTAVLRATVKDLEWKKGLSARNGASASRESL